MLLFAAQALGLGAAPASDVSAPTAPSWLLVTNVWQMHQVLGQQWRARCSLALTGIVCDASAPRGALVLADATGTEMFAMDLGGQVLNAGQRVALTGDNCELVRRRSEIALHRAPLIDSDGLHPVVEQSNSLTLATGRHPLRVEWFNADGKAVLEAAVAAQANRVETWLWNLDWRSAVSWATGLSCPILDPIIPWRSQEWQPAWT